MWVHQACDEDGEVFSMVYGLSTGLGLKGLSVRRKVSPSLWVTAEEKEWRWHKNLSVGVKKCFHTVSQPGTLGTHDQLSFSGKTGQLDCSLGELPIKFTKLGTVNWHLLDFIRVFWFFWLVKSWFIKSGYRLPSSAPSWSLPSLCLLPPPPPHQSLNSSLAKIRLRNGQQISDCALEAPPPPLQGNLDAGQWMGGKGIWIWILLVLLQCEHCSHLLVPRDAQVPSLKWCSICI